MKQTPINYSIVKQELENSGIRDLSLSSIREIVKLVSDIEKKTGEKFIRMEMGVPGLEPPQIAIDAEINALRHGVASKYAAMDGAPSLKNEAARFAKLFLNIDISPQCCIATVGSMQGSMAAFLVANRTDHSKEGTLFIDPGFPVHKQQVQVIGHDYHAFDIYNFRGKKLRQKLEGYLSSGKISSILYSNPNNPAWICLTDEELQTIGELANKYDAIVLEDLAYFAMDFRKDYSTPGKPPFQPSVAKYTDNYILLISSSKSFSYAGQRIGLIMVSDSLFQTRFPDLRRFYATDHFGNAIIYGALYALSAGVGHSAQLGLAAMLKAVNNGEYNFVEIVKEYGERAKIMKQMFQENGFQIVYKNDGDTPIADGFYFTLAYPGFSSAQLLEKLLYYGISAISLKIAGSKIEGLRACVSQTARTQFSELEYRLRCFHRDYPVK